MYVLAERKLKRDQQEELRNRRYADNGNGNGNGNGVGAYENGRHAISHPLLPPTDDWSKPAHQPHAFVHHGVESESNHSDSVSLYNSLFLT